MSIDTTDDIMSGLDAWITSYIVPRIQRLGGVVTARDIQRHVWRFRYSGNALLSTMVQYGFGHWEQVPSGPRGGRPKRRFVLTSTVPVAKPADQGIAGGISP